MTMNKISKARFEALSYARAPIVKYMSREVEWYSSETNNILGVILFDYADSDYAIIVLGRDEVGVFRAISWEVSIVTLDNAREILEERINQFDHTGDDEFPQGIANRNKILIFSPLVQEEKMPSDYKTLVNSEFFSPAREIIQEAAYSFEDPDGNYIEQFQSSGFNSRLWELYLYAFFHEMDFLINRDFNAPDYIIEKRDVRLCIEAVTVNPSQHNIDEPEPTNDEEKIRLLSDYMPIKYGSPLYTKLKKKYWEKDHVSGHPLLIAIHDYHQKDSMMWSRPALETYLYGAKRTYSISPQNTIEQHVETIAEHRWNDKVIPSNFFAQPDSENISAVIHSNQATIGKFLRMGFLAEFGRKDIEIIFKGLAMYDNKRLVEFENAVVPYEYEEKWKDSITIYHNPNAIHPLDHTLFPNVAHVFFADGIFSSIKPFFYPIYGRTFYRAKEA